MKHKEFTDKYNQKYIDFDQNNSYQCVDLMRKYVKEVFNIPGYNSDLPALGNWGHAKDLFYKFPAKSKYFKKVYNTPVGVPPQGAIVFFKTSVLPKWLYGIDGHVAIVDSATVMEMILFGQNYPTKFPSSFRRFTYKDCLGWLIRI